MAHPSKGQKAKRGKKMAPAEFARLWLDSAIRVCEIAKLLGISSEAVCSRARTRNLPNRTEAGIVIRPRKIDAAVFAELYQAMVGTKDLCAFFKVSHPMIGRTADRLKIPRRALRKGAASISIEEYRANKLRTAMATTAEIERGHWKNAEMVDGQARVGRWAA